MNLQEKLDRYHERRKQENRPVSKWMLETLMDNIDFESTMAKLGIEVKKCGADEYVGYCPNHLEHASAPPSDPKWYISSKTGRSWCMTKSVASNIIEVARYVLGLDTNKDAYEELLSGRPVEVKIHFDDQPKMEERKEDNAEKLKNSLSQVIPFYDNPQRSQLCLDYFAKDGIVEETLDYYGIVSPDHGRYKDRAIIPFMNEKNEFCGYVAVDLLGKEEWAKQNARRVCSVDTTLDFESCRTELLKKYRKTLYAPGFEGRFHLYGLYEHPDFSSDVTDVMLVEGERDTLKMLQEGIRCLGCHGTSIKTEQKIMLNRLLVNTKHLFLGFDMDEAGDKAVDKAFESLSEIIDSNKIYVLNFPSDKQGNKQDPKKFNGRQIRRLMDYAVENNIRRRTHAS